MCRVFGCTQIPFPQSGKTTLRPSVFHLGVLAAMLGVVSSTWQFGKSADPRLRFLGHRSVGLGAIHYGIRKTPIPASPFRHFVRWAARWALPSSSLHSLREPPRPHSDGSEKTYTAGTHQYSNEKVRRSPLTRTGALSSCERRHAPKSGHLSNAFPTTRRCRKTASRPYISPQSAEQAWLNPSSTTQTLSHSSQRLPGQGVLAGQCSDEAGNAYVTPTGIADEVWPGSPGRAASDRAAWRFPWRS